MRELTCTELEAVSGGELTEEEAHAITVTMALMAVAPTPPVLAAGTVAILYYTWC